MLELVLGIIVFLFEDNVRYFNVVIEGFVEVIDIN